MGIVIPVLIFIFILGIVIFVHEMGHFLAARRAGIFVEEFALGMGPKIFSRKGTKQSSDGEVTVYSLRAFPIGGFCKMRGQDDDLPDDAEALNNKSIWARFTVMAGGSVMNFLMAFVLFFVFIMARGVPTPTIFVSEITTGMPGEQAGLMAGDFITHIDGTRVDLVGDLVSVINAADGRALDIRVDRDGVRHDLSITPVFHDGRYLIGLTFFNSMYFQPASVFQGVSGSAELIGMQVMGPFHLLSRLLQGESLPEGEGLVGPIGIGGMITEAYQETIQYGFFDMFLTMLLFTGAINAALGMMNLLPVPGLDGARIVFLLIEAVRRKPVPPEKEAIVHLVGIVSLLLLAVFIAYRDIARLINISDYAG
ncbi:MAG: M50 family metallopeptidase [Defluviitaleaceae bacterium]|nr:M50 family metallopeptidase [Defluviitaleaceae bacterium]